MKQERQIEAVHFSTAPPKVVLLGSKGLEERRALYYSKKETALFRTEAHNDAECWRSSVTKDNDGNTSEPCPLGLERITGDAYGKRRKYMALVQVICDEQKRQDYLGVYVPAAIHKLASMCSRWDQHRAQEIASAEVENRDLLPRGINAISDTRDKLSNRKVKFGGGPGPYVTVHENPRTPDEVEKTWYSRKELQVIRSETRATLELLKNNELSSDSDTHCIRGLERYVPSLLESRRSQRAVAIVVVDEDKNQRKWGVCEPEVIEKLSQMCSRHARHKALEYAALDAAIAASSDESPQKKRERILSVCRRNIVARGLPARAYSLARSVAV